MEPFPARGHLIATTRLTFLALESACTGTPLRLSTHRWSVRVHTRRRLRDVRASRVARIPGPFRIEALGLPFEGRRVCHPSLSRSRGPAGGDYGSGRPFGGRVDAVKPDVVVNCVGASSTGGGEGSDRGAHHPKRVLPHQLSRICRTAGSRPNSSDCVFSGRKGLYTEDDTSHAGSTAHQAVRSVVGRRHHDPDVDYRPGIARHDRGRGVQFPPMIDVRIVSAPSDGAFPSSLVRPYKSSASGVSSSVYRPFRPENTQSVLRWIRPGTGVAADTRELVGEQRVGGERHDRILRPRQLLHHTDAIHHHIRFDGVDTPPNGRHIRDLHRRHHARSLEEGWQTLRPSKRDPCPKRSWNSSHARCPNIPEPPTIRTRTLIDAWRGAAACRYGRFRAQET